MKDSTKFITVCGVVLLICGIILAIYFWWSGEKEKQLEEQKGKVELALNKIAEEQEQAKQYDSDKDGLTDDEELTIYDTDPKDKDTDKDGFEDGEEVVRGYNPNKRYDEGDRVVPDMTSGDSADNYSSKMIELLTGKIEPGKDYTADEIDAIASVYLKDVDVIEEIEEIDESELNITDEVNSDTVRIFLETKSKSLVTLQELTNESSGVSELVSQAKAGRDDQLDLLIGAANKAYFEIKNIPVPKDKDTLKLHKDNLKMVLMTKALLESLKLSDTDPMKAAIGTKISQDIGKLAEESKTRVQTIREQYGLLASE